MADLFMNLNLTMEDLKKIASCMTDEMLLKAIDKNKDNSEACEIFMQEYDRRHQEPCDSCRM